MTEQRHDRAEPQQSSAMTKQRYGRDTARHSNGQKIESAPRQQRQKRMGSGSGTACQRQWHCTESGSEAPAAGISNGCGATQRAAKHGTVAAAQGNRSPAKKAEARHGDRAEQWRLYPRVTRAKGNKKSLTGVPGQGLGASRA
jgi:hypothetical protein